MTDTPAPRTAPDDATARVAAAVRAELARANVSGRALAHALGYGHHAFGRRLSGRLPFRVDELDAIARHLGVPLARLYETPTASSTADAG